MSYAIANRENYAANETDPLKRPEVITKLQKKKKNFIIFI